MSPDSLGPLNELLDGGFGHVLKPSGFVSSRNRRSWIRGTGEVEHIISLLKRRNSFDIQWGLVCPQVVDVMWGMPYRPFDVGQAIVSGTPGTIQHPAKAQSFASVELASNTSEIVSGVRDDLTVVEDWMRPFRRRADIRNYLLENRDATDLRAFIIPSKLPLKLFTAAALAIADGDPAGCSLMTEAEMALAPFGGDITTNRLNRLNRMAASLCG